MSFPRDEGLLEYATPRQKEVLLAYWEHGSDRKVAAALGCSKSLPGQIRKAVQKKAAAHGYAPDYDLIHKVPEPFMVKGTSTLYDEAGKPRLQWVKTAVDEEKRLAIVEEVFEGMASALPRLKPLPAPKQPNEALCNLYTLTDCHMGMLAWHKEGGDDWDVKIAEKTLLGCFRHMVSASPNAKIAIINQLGDFLHSDGLLPITPTSGHILDQDGRFSKIVAATVRVLRAVTDLALQKHDQVHVIMAEGNHDLASSVWLRHMFSALYENEPRLTVNDSELPYYAFQHGKVMLAFHHGHLKKNPGLPLHFAAQYSEMWGATEKRYCHTGHRHHVDEKEHPGMTVIQHPTLAAKDSYASRGGWLSERQAQSITYHSEFGQVARNNVTPEMLE